MNDSSIDIFDAATEDSQSTLSEDNSNAAGNIESRSENVQRNVVMNPPRYLAVKRKRDPVDSRVDRALDLIESRQNNNVDDEEETFGKWVGQALRNTTNPLIKLWMQEQITKIINDGKRKSLLQTNRSTSSASHLSSFASDETEEDTEQYELYDVSD